jgi:hypothetical protein
MSRQASWADRAEDATPTALGWGERGVTRRPILQTPDPLAPLFEVLHDLIEGRCSPRINLGVVFPVACVCFWGGALMSFWNLPAGFDYGRCVISRLCSQYHNPHGYAYMSVGMMVTPVLLWCFSGWLVRGCQGCERLRRAGWATTRVGLVSTVMVGAERCWFPTHWTRFEALHLVFAAVAFGGLWLGLAMLEGASDESASRVRWQWLLRPPWYLVLTLLPILVVFGMCGPINLVPGARSIALENWPRSLVFLRTLTFWQWYLTIGLGISFASAGLRRQRAESGSRAQLDGWRLDSATTVRIPLSRTAVAPVLVSSTHRPD